MKFIVLLIVVMVVNKIKSDLPVHCIAREIKGRWVITASSRLVSMDKKCGHMIPDKNTDHVNNLNYLNELI
jgi:hypothetical protein